MYVVIEGMELQNKVIPIGRIKAKVLDLMDRVGQKVQVNTIEEGLTVSDEWDTWFERVLDFARDRAELSPLIKDEYYTDITISLGSYYYDLVYFGCNQERKSFIRVVNQFIPEPDQIIFLQAPFNELTLQITQDYYKVLPLNVRLIHAQEMSEEETVHLIALHILLEWLTRYQPEYDPNKLLQEYEKYVNHKKIEVNYE